ncbi:hypothetical protein Vadar_014881 [Vaccinium darrowii]|uniref:Uncharacterized protein n=1 Tax=Vaccinium darrowii TaxID=229202 RepID=A0ACB7Z410_9ERIC|nr:hypothetical protein Vadar_014881 [Vaccinium darrowii]
MESYEILGFLGILKECMKAISKNVKLIATITTISILLDSLLSFTKSFSTKPAISDLVTQATLYNLSKNNTSNFTDSYEKMIMEDVQIIIGFEFLYFLPSIAIYVFSMVTMILASVVAYSDKNLSFRDFLPRIPRLCLRTLATSFYLKIFAIGYIVLFSAFLISLMLLNIDHPLVILPIVIILGVFAVIFWMYLDVAWDMALVVSVIEKNSYGLEALGILRECMKAISKNGKLIATITTITILLDSLLLFTKSFSTKPAISDLVTQETFLNLSNPNTPNFADSVTKIMKDVHVIIGFELVYLLPSIAISIFCTVTMILASVVAYSDKNLSFRDFLSRIPKLCLRTLVTSFYLKLLTVGYIFVFLAFLISLMILNMDHPLVLIPIAITLGIFASIFLMYLSVAWNMALVISVIEKNCYGLEALGKAGGLVKGRRIHGFALSVLCTSVMVIIGLVFRVCDSGGGVLTPDLLLSSILGLLITFVSIPPSAVCGVHWVSLLGVSGLGLNGIRTCLLLMLRSGVSSFRLGFFRFHPTTVVVGRGRSSGPNRLGCLCLALGGEWWHWAVVVVGGL